MSAQLKDKNHMNKDFSEKKLLSFNLEKQFKTLYDLASFIEKNKHDYESSHFMKLKKYHSYLEQVDSPLMQKLTKEFQKVSKIDYQFQIYLMNLERFLGQSKKEYDFIVDTGDTQKQQKHFPIICILDSIRSAHNVGSFFRNAECFGVQKLVLSGLTPTPENDQVKKTSMGCDQNVSWEKVDSLNLYIKELKRAGVIIISVETGNQAVNLNQLTIDKEQSIALIFGHEQHGVSLELLKQSDKIAAITLYGNKNSLNVSISQAIALNHFSQQYSS